MRERKFPDQKPPEGVAARTGQPPRSLGQEVSGRCGRWAKPVKRRHEESLVRSESIMICMSTLIAHVPRVYTYLVVGDIVVGAHPLDLSGRQHPADIVDDLQVRGCGLHGTQSRQTLSNHGQQCLDEPS